MSLKDRLSFGSGRGDAGGGAPSRLFLIIAIGLVGMLVLGLVGIGGYVLFSRTMRARTEQVALLPTETPTEGEVGVTDTPTPSPIPTMTPTPRPTDTPTRAPTFTPVVIPAVVTPIVAGEETPTATRVVGAEAPGATTVAMATTPTVTPTFTPVVVAKGDATPQTGLSLGGVVGIGLVLATLAVAARRLRSVG